MLLGDDALVGDLLRSREDDVEKTEELVKKTTAQQRIYFEECHLDRK